MGASRHPVCSGSSKCASIARCVCVQRQYADDSAILKGLPLTQMYERSFMHRDTVTHVATAAAHDFIITGSSDGDLRFWKILSVRHCSHISAMYCQLTAAERTQAVLWGNSHLMLHLSISPSSRLIPLQQYITKNTTECHVGYWHGEG